LLGTDRSVRFETVTDRSDSISAKVSATGCALLVIPRQTPDTPSEPAFGFAAAIDCPLVLVA
ncbi:MAG: hypothetical protein OES09_08545, partial [Gammaproteobacteria bacterium]|nr:hypothetical protein [Gammaproteobacteria bacterium]